MKWPSNPIGLQKLAPQRDEVDVRTIQDQLDPHQHAQRVPLDGHADDAACKHDGADNHVMGHAD
jgi:hypothetical protein